MANPDIFLIDKLNSSILYKKETKKDDTKLKNELNNDSPVYFI